VAVLTGYFDESGIHEGDHLCVVSGFIGNDAQWGAFVNDWIPAIKPRPNLHMVKLKWDRYPHLIAPLLAKLGPIPHKYNLKPLSVSVPWRDYNCIVKAKVDGEFANPYITCAMSCIAVALTQIIGKDDIYFWFDWQEGLRRETMEKLKSLVFDLAGVDSRVKGMDFIKRKNTVCTDPGDYLAYIVRERGIDENSPKAIMGKSIIGSGGYGGQIRPEQLEEMVAYWQSDRTIKSLMEEFSRNPFFRGLK
jgi:hypothetical protein